MKRWLLPLLGLLLLVAIAYVLRPVFTYDVCLTRMVRLSAGLRAYLHEHDNTFPPADQWQDALGRYLASDKSLSCPESKHGTGGCAFNASLGGIGIEALQDPRDTVAFFETDAALTTASGPELLPGEPRHDGRDNYVFADGHVQRLPRKKNPDGSWSKQPDADWVIWDPALDSPQAPAEGRP